MRTSKTVTEYEIVDLDAITKEAVRDHALENMSKFKKEKDFKKIKKFLSKLFRSKN